MSDEIRNSFSPQWVAPVVTWMASADAADVTGQVIESSGLVLAIAEGWRRGPWQVPVADVAVTTMGYRTNLGEAFAMGERTPLAILSAPASGRMAIGEALTNIAAANISGLGDVKLSANWMAAAGSPGEDASQR